MLMDNIDWLDCTRRYFNTITTKAIKYGKFPSKLLHITKKKILKVFGALIKGQQQDVGHE